MGRCATSLSPARRPQKTRHKGGSVELECNALRSSPCLERLLGGEDHPPALDIQDLDGSRHDKVKQSIERLAKNGVIQLPPVGISEETNSLGLPQRTKLYIFTAETKRDSYIVVAQLSPEFTARLVDRWQELEAETAKPFNPAILSRMQLLELAMQAEQERIAMEQHVAVIQPKADALDLIATGSEGSLNITETAKTIQVQPKALFRWLQAAEWIYRRAGGSGWVAYQNRIKQGYLEHKVTTVRREDGTEKVVEQVRVTSKGLTKLAGAFNGGLA